MFMPFSCFLIFLFDFLIQRLYTRDCIRRRLVWDRCVPTFPHFTGGGIGAMGSLITDPHTPGLGSEGRTLLPGPCSFKLQYFTFANRATPHFLKHVITLTKQISRSRIRWKSTTATNCRNEGNISWLLIFCIFLLSPLKLFREMDNIFV